MANSSITSTQRTGGLEDKQTVFIFDLLQILCSFYIMSAFRFFFSHLPFLLCYVWMDARIQSKLIQQRSQADRIQSSWHLAKTVVHVAHNVSCIRFKPGEKNHTLNSNKGRALDNARRLTSQEQHRVKHPRVSTVQRWATWKMSRNEHRKWRRSVNYRSSNSKRVENAFTDFWNFFMKCECWMIKRTK